MALPVDKLLSSDARLCCEYRVLLQVCSLSLVILHLLAVWVADGVGIMRLA